MNTTCIHGEIGIPGTEVRGKKTPNKIQTTTLPKRSTSNKSGKNMLLQQHWAQRITDSYK